MNPTQTDEAERSSEWLDVLKVWVVLWTVAGSVVAMAAPLTSMLVDSAP